MRATLTVHSYRHTYTKQSETWRVKLKLASQTLEFKIDNGAEVRAITDMAFSAFKGLKLDRPKKMLYGPARDNQSFCRGVLCY